MQDGTVAAKSAGTIAAMLFSYMYRAAEAQACCLQFLKAWLWLVADALQVAGGALPRWQPSWQYCPPFAQAPDNTSAQNRIL